jgi:hypothetical protein
MRSKKPKLIFFKKLIIFYFICRLQNENDNNLKSALNNAETLKKYLNLKYLLFDSLF